MTVSLHLIVKDEVEAVSRLVEQAKPYFDGIFITVSDKKAYEVLKKLPVGVDYREWNGRFDDARNHNWAFGKGYDVSFWLDADDSFDFSTIPNLVEKLGEFDAIFLPYHYDHDENGNLIVSHWRERLVKRDKGFYWKGWVHENLISDQYFTKTNVNIPVIHKQVEGHKEVSAQRNHKILEKAFKETDDPRYIHYYGVSLFTLHRYEEAIEVLKKYCEVGGWDEEIYRSLLKMAEASHLLGNYDNSINYSLQAVSLMPDYPMAYELMAHFEFQAKKYKESLEWVKMALKKPYPETASIFDPTSKDRAILTGALCEFHLGNFRDAAELIRQVKTTDTSELIGEFDHEASVERLRAILPALFKHYKEPKVLWEALNDDIKYRPEFRKIREKFTEPKDWPKKSIVFFCGKGYEEWGPHTLDKGMGGSEEAVVYLSRELSKLGYDVTVYGSLEKPHTDSVDIGNDERTFVHWYPWTMIDKRDYFDILVVWRSPQFATQFKANKILIDMHDILPRSVVKPYNATYLFKSDYMAELYDVDDYKIIPNGVVVDQFKPAKKKEHSVIYPSAYYRGLETLLDLWPEVLKEVPDATLDVYYGWESWVALEGENEFYHRMVEKLKNTKNVKEHGRVAHKTLAKKLSQSKVWAYPTEFPEIFCITAVKANLAGCKPVITDVAALKETGGPQAEVIETDKIYGDEYSQKKFVKALVKALKEPHDPKKQIEWAKEYDWASVAKRWKNLIG